MTDANFAVLLSNQVVILEVLLSELKYTQACSPVAGKESLIKSVTEILDKDHELLEDVKNAFKEAA